MLGRASSTVQPVQDKHLSRGKVTDRPWGMTLGALAAGGHTGQLAITTADRKMFRLVLVNGLLADATSPVSADSIARVALTLRMIPAPHAAEIHKRVTRTPDRDELAIAAEVTGLRPDELARLRRQAILQRAARTFSLEAGTYRFERLAAGLDRGVEIALEEVIYAGARLHVDPQRMSTDLRQLGSRFAMEPEARPLVTRFGFTEVELPIFRALERGTSVAELEAPQYDLDPRVARATVYALACCGVIARAEGTPASRAAAPAIAQPRTITANLVPRKAAPRAPQGLSRAEIETLIADRCSLIDAGRDLFAVLGLELGASIEAVQSAYLELAAYIHPERLAAFGVPAGEDAQRLFARAGIAYATLTQPAHRASYLEQHVADPRESVPVRDDDRVPLAHEAAARAARLMAANRPGAAVAELARACELAPDDADYRAMLAWAAFCASPNKPQLEQVTRRSLLGALDDVRHPEQVRTYLGRMERMLGRDLEALEHFLAVLAMMPDHVEAATEVRVIEARIARGTKRLR